MKKYIKLAAAVSAALVTQYASAGMVTMYGDGGSIQIPGNSNFQVASVYENIVTSVGQELKGYGELTQINGQPISNLCTNCELTFVFDNYFVSSITGANASFTGGNVSIYLGFGANNDFNPFASGSSAADIAAATNGALFLTLKGHEIAPGGVTLSSVVSSGNLLTPSFRFNGGGLWDVDMSGLGLANGNFNTNSFLAAFGGPTADMSFNTSGDTNFVPHAGECQPGPQGQPSNGAACVAGSADIRGYVIPEPGTLALAGLGLMGLGFGGKRRKAA
ncbi:MAG: PEP-CTERM sorting domain-containing protein [Azonexus sp.]|nr:PEP-CTERM sorting domain-containing protein [Azonexus sp.]